MKLQCSQLMSYIYKSSFRFTTLSAISKDDFRKARHIISHIIDNPQSTEFRVPVNWESFGLLDYPALVPYPMDLGTVLQKINDQKYENVEEFLDDTQLIWDNCKTYNLKGSWIYQLADKLEKNCKKMLKNYFPSIPLQNVKKEGTGSQSAIALNPPPPSQAVFVEARYIPQAPKLSKLKKSQKQERGQKSERLYYQDEQEIAFSQKMKLADKFKVLTPQQNAEIVDFIQAICPAAFLQMDDKAQVLVDNMDIITFKQLLEKVEEIELNAPPFSSKRIKSD